jgi:hypothetical protein
MRPTIAMTDFKEPIKRLNRLLDALREADKASGDPQARQVALEAALKALTALQEMALNEALASESGEAARAVSGLIDQRRYAVAEAARAAGWTVTRLGERDRVGDFYVHYSKSKVRLLVGSEELTTSTEADGKKLFALIQDELRKLESAVLPRSDFFGVLRIALSMAKADGRGSNGRVNIRELFPYIAVSRQLAFESFRKKPVAKNFADYSMPLLALELHRFGDSEEGWHYGEYRISNQPPNMATQHEALQLPGASGAQVLGIGIE